ncbi:MAG: ATP-binding cassette domain-containing protein [Lachnospiraceae bacterium]|nr:ATP-binding cassette domain-containing protein [Ruminococcus sp.]MCM1276734.1 ATP-binding cassette domain-containing protein [Lachnospiraceae bacterium]
MELLALKNLTFRYPGRDKPALDNVSLSVGEGDFLVVCGRSGSGKTTLLRQLKPQLAPHGERGGEILFGGRPLSALGERESAALIGFVRQSPDEQIVTDKVWHELAFGLESLGCDAPTIRRRVAETASFFGVESLFRKSVSELSGGQKQLLNLAAVTVMQPKLLILDEPTAQLDPIAASEFLAALKRINTELGTTVILTEHRLEEALPLASVCAAMEDGRLLFSGSPSELGGFLKASGHEMFPAMPSAMRVWSSVGANEKCPVSVSEGRRFLAGYTAERPVLPVPKKTPRALGEEKISLRGAYFRYERELPDVVRNADFSARAGELVCVLGGNGAGKTTLLKLLAGLKKPYRGEVKANGKIRMLPQEPRLLFAAKTVYAELESALPDKMPEEQKRERIAQTLSLCRLENLGNCHPYDLSGGEIQRAALAKLLLSEPEILLLDEPTKGLDAELKAELADILGELLGGGACVVTVSHDAEFCAEYADRCALFFDGSVVSEGEPRDFFSGNAFYTTAAGRMSRGIIPNAVTVSDVIAAIGGKLPERKKRPPAETAPLPKKTAINCKPAPEKTKKKLPKRTKVAVALVIFFIPLTLYLGLVLLDNKQYYITATAVLIECMLPFFMVFEGRKPLARELVLIAVLCALGIAGRAAFFMLPQFKPVLAVVIIAGASLGAETGFLVGAATMLVSNIMFSQGAWTPWQMFAAGVIGFLAGALCRTGLLKRSRLPLSIFGAVSALVIYGGIMNPVSALLQGTEELSLGVILGYYVTGLPMDLVHALATAVFLWFLSKPMLETLERVKLKYGLLDK